MSEKLNIVYVGTKPEKRIFINQKKLVFRGNAPLPVDVETANQLLEYPEVFADESEAKERLDKQKAKDKALEDQRKAELEAAAQQAAEESWEVMIDGEVVDISKYTKGQLAAVIESEELNIIADGVRLPELRETVRAALRQKAEA